MITIAIILYGEGSKLERDQRFAQAMEQVARDFPDDDEARLFHSLALLGLSQGERNLPNFLRAGELRAKGQPAYSCGHYAEWLQYGYFQQAREREAYQVFRTANGKARKRGPASKTPCAPWKPRFGGVFFRKSPSSRSLGNPTQ